MIAQIRFVEPSTKPGYRGKPPINLPRLLDEDLRICSKLNSQTHLLDHNYTIQPKMQLKTMYDLQKIKEKAQDRDYWKQLTQQVVEGRQGEIW